MQVEEYRNNLMESLEIKAKAGLTDKASEFLIHATELLINAEEINDFTEAYIETTGAKNISIKLHGYTFDESEYTCSLFINDFSYQSEITTITNEQVTNLYRKMEAFVKNAQSGYIEKNAELTSEAYTLADLLNENINNETVAKYKFYILSNQLLSDRVKTIKKDPIEGSLVEVNVWDLKRLFELEESNTGKESIEIDLSEYGGEGLPGIKAISGEQGNYEAYLTTIRGDVLANIYLEYGARLLEGNVRSFLSNRGKVNKGIRSTLLNQPDMFFAYNNGIAATASAIEFTDNGSGIIINKIHNLQIINGGQTTASIANVVIKKEGSVESVFVPVKISVIKDETTEQIIPEIAKCANSQNKIDDADFTTNHPFNIRLESMSRKILAPAVHGNQFKQGWFFERAKGQYVQAQMKLSPGQKKEFAIKWPKDQIIKKTDLGKYMMSYLKNPHIVSRGSQYSAASFHHHIVKKKWEENDSQFNEEYYKLVVALSIIYRKTERLITSQDWYQEIKSYRAQILCYTLSVIFYLVDQMPDKSLDFKRIWNNQELYPELEVQLKITSKEVLTYITRKMLNVTQWCKKVECWDGAKKENWTLNKDFIESLISKRDIQNDQKAAGKEIKVEKEMQDLARIFSLSQEDWERILTCGLNKKILYPIEVDLLELVINFYKNPKVEPSKKQAVKIISIQKKLYDEGCK